MTEKSYWKEIHLNVRTYPDDPYNRNNPRLLDLVPQIRDDSATLNEDMARSLAEDLLSWVNNSECGALIAIGDSSTLVCSLLRGHFGKHKTEVSGYDISWSRKVTDRDVEQG